jgi:hypothetical protein
MDDCDHLFWPNPNQHYTPRQAPFLAEWMTEPELQNQIATLQRWLAAA